MCYPSSNITYCIACLLCIGVILLNKFNQSINQALIPKMSLIYTFSLFSKSSMSHYSLQICFQLVSENVPENSCFPTKKYYLIFLNFSFNFLCEP